MSSKLLGLSSRTGDNVISTGQSTTGLAICKALEADDVPYLEGVFGPCMQRGESCPFVRLNLLAKGQGIEIRMRVSMKMLISDVHPIWFWGGSGKARTRYFINVF
ncbi:hypothetical protein N7G274_008753 [Stereocaulon virgatum]|uniref:Uncharacterized protein n=1 Tax=Stereocaulon virgatum TaxID=373712 RepID=A0ABR3ZXK2_9LECA